MSANILNGKLIAAELRESIKQEVDTQIAAGNIRPGLAVIMVGEDPASQVYVRNKKLPVKRLDLMMYRRSCLPILLKQTF